jgi:tetraacyldisaccharide 4'-kinase
MREPALWWRRAGPAASLLNPLGLIYGAIAARRLAGNGTRAGIPVICVGNFTLGGAGKTPTVMLLARMFADLGKRPFCLSRGYGGDVVEPKLVNADADNAAQVGDEPLLLARVAPTVVALDRVAGATFARAQGAGLIILDDGLQNSSLAKDFTLAVIDARRGIGNACVFPAGPLRAPLDAQLAQTDALLVVGNGSEAQKVIAQARAKDRPIFHGRLEPDRASIATLQGKGVLAFAGIGDPDKFFTSTVEAGLDVRERRAFADHHRYTAREASDLIALADHKGLAIVTTEKDRARLAGDRSLAALADRAQALRVAMVIDSADELCRLAQSKINR